MNSETRQDLAKDLPPSSRTGLLALVAFPAAALVLLAGGAFFAGAFLVTSFFAAALLAGVAFGLALVADVGFALGFGFGFGFVVGCQGVGVENESGCQDADKIFKVWIIAGSYI